MTQKQLIRKRNNLVQLAISLKGEQLNSVEFAIKALDLIIDNAEKDTEQNNELFICINYEILHLNNI